MTFDIVLDALDIDDLEQLKEKIEKEILNRKADSLGLDLDNDIHSLNTIHKNKWELN